MTSLTRIKSKYYSVVFEIIFLRAQLLYYVEYSTSEKLYGKPNFSMYSMQDRSCVRKFRRTEHLIFAVLYE